MDIQSSTSSSTASESSTPAPSQTLAPWAGQYIKTGGKRACVSCSYCARDITSSCRMRCAICVSVSVNTHNRYTSKSVQAPVELCADCFASGVSFEDHVPTHAYQVVDCVSEFPVLVSDWTAHEELLLLEGIEKCGFGNWKLISEYISSKTLKQVEDHVYDVFIKYHGLCLPQTFINKEGTFQYTAEYLEQKQQQRAVSPAPLPVVSTTSSSTTGPAKSPVPNPFTNADPVLNPPNYPALMLMKVRQGRHRGEEVIRGVTSGSTATGSSAAARSASRQSSATPTTVATSQVYHHAPVTSDLPGFLPLREDFDVEPENDAETLLADMEFSPDDHISERELKLQVLRIYQKKLDERNRRKRFVIDRGLVDVKKQQQIDKRRTREEREIVAKMNIFARFQSQEEHEALVDAVLRARRLEHNIELLQLYRSMGIRNIEQVRAYESDRKRREQDLKQLSRQGSNKPSYSYASGSSSPYTPGGIGGNSFVDLDSYSQSASKRGRRSGGGGIASMASSDSVSTGLNEAADSPYIGDSSSFGGLSISATGDNSKESNELSRAPGAELLSKMELDLCVKIRMLPYAYIAMKDCLIREAFRTGVLTEQGVHRHMKLDHNTNAMVYDFFVKALDINGIGAINPQTYPYAYAYTHGQMSPTFNNNNSSSSSSGSSMTSAASYPPVHPTTFSSSSSASTSSASNSTNPYDYRPYVGQMVSSADYVAPEESEQAPTKGKPGRKRKIQ